MKTILLCLAVGLLCAAAVQADLTKWQVKLGLGGNVYPYANDFATRMGVDPVATWSYDSRDSVHPTDISPEFDLTFRYTEGYQRVFAQQTPHDVAGFHWDSPLGWPPGAPYPPRPDDPTPPYPSRNLIKDLRPPVNSFLGQVEFWTIDLAAPNEGATCSFAWALNTEAGLEVPESIDLRIWSNPDLLAAGISGDLVLTAYSSGAHEITGIPQFGLDSQGDPIVHEWVVQATLIPEPNTLILLGVGLGSIAASLRRRK